jgi:integration host factor subunit beta
MRGSYHMTKSDLIAALALKENLTEKLAMDIVNLVFDGFANALKNGGRIEIRGFGSFVMREYDAYKGRNPKTGKVVEVKPKKLPFFKVGSELKSKLLACVTGYCILLSAKIVLMI